MQTALLTLILAGVGSVSVVPTADASGDLGWRSGFCCGPNSLYVVLRICGMRPDYRSLVEEMDLTDRGASVADLIRVAQNNGLALTPLRAEAGMLDTLPLPAIVHFHNPGDDQGHYLVLLSRNESEAFAIVECTRGTITHLSRGAFLERWSGVILVCSDHLPDHRADYALLGLSGGVLLLLAVCFVRLKNATDNNDRRGLSTPQV